MFCDLVLASNKIKVSMLLQDTLYELHFITIWIHKTINVYLRCNLSFLANCDIQNIHIYNISILI